MKVDLFDQEAVMSVLKEAQPDLVINAAAYTAVDKAESDSVAARTLNGVVPGLIARFCADQGIPLLHFSTDYIYGAQDSDPQTENAPTNPLNVYGQTKWEGDEAIRAAGCAHLILRISWVYGAFGANFAKTMLRLGRQQSDLKIVGDQYGAPSGASFLASATSFIATKLLAQPDVRAAFQKKSGVYHLCPSGATSWHGFAEKIFATAKARGVPLAVRSVQSIPTTDYPTPARRPLNSRLNTSKVQEAFGLILPTWEDVWELESMRLMP